MANVKIELQEGETIEQAEEVLFKALRSQRDGSIHQDGKFHDPAIEELSIKLIKLHEAEYNLMLQEIFKELEDEHGNVE